MSSHHPDHGRRFGPYRVERLLGEGGMSSVFLAQREGDYEQQVALKLVHPGPSSEEIVARLYNERQILARLQHPYIARLLDGGTTEDAVPYFVMEYVDGEHIDEYCEARKLSIRERLELFRKVCSAVQFAHQNLVVHRDLKPGNILITADGVPKLLDFGIAKILRPELASRGLETAPGRHPMTAAYASPEQLLGEVITTTSDVYSLGVLLYRLLSGHSPYLVEECGYGELVRVICLEDPQRPSATVYSPGLLRGRKATTTQAVDGLAVGPKTTVAEPGRRARGKAAAKAAERRLRRDECRSLRRRLAGDLDAIVLKAMRKEPEHRYGSAEQLSEDVRHHLAGLPVRARQGTWSYRAGKFARRHKLGLAMVLLIVAFAVTTTVLWRQAVDERVQAERQRTRAERVSSFLQDLFKSAGPDAAQGETVTVREILDRGKEEINQGLEGELEVQAALLRSLGTVYADLGLYDEARELKERALQIRTQVSSEDDPELATELSNLARIIYDLGDYEEAERYYREALEMRQRLGQSDTETVRTMSSLAMALTQRGAYAEAEALHFEVLAIRVKLWGAEDPDVAVTRHCLGELYYARGELDKAESFLRQALDIYSLTYGAEHTRVASVLNGLGRVLHRRSAGGTEGGQRRQGDYEEAELAYQNALEIRRKRFGEGDNRVADTKKNLAALLLAQGETATAGVLLEQALTVLHGYMPEGHWTVADAEGVLGLYLLELGCYEEAELYLTRSYRIIRDVKGDDAIFTRQALKRLVRLYDAWNKPAEAERYRSAEPRPPR